MALLMCGATAAEPVKVTWHPSADGDVLQVNGIDMDKVEFSFREKEADEDLVNRLCATAAPGMNARKDAIHVTIPVQKDQPYYSSRIPTPFQFLGAQEAIFLCLLAPEHDVHYFYGGREVRRYLILASDKNGARFPEEAEYWLDGKPLGRWLEAKLEFAKVKWEQDAIVDATFDAIDPLLSSGIGFNHIPNELTDLLWKHRISVNCHMRYRPLPTNK